MGVPPMLRRPGTHVYGRDAHVATPGHSRLRARCPRSRAGRPCCDARALTFTGEMPTFTGGTPVPRYGPMLPQTTSLRVTTELNRNWYSAELIKAQTIPR